MKQFRYVVYNLRKDRRISMASFRGVANAYSFIYDLAEEEFGYKYEIYDTKNRTRQVYEYGEWTN